MLRPLADRVLIKPLEEAPASSLITLTDHQGPATVGEVVAVGNGSRVARARLVSALTLLADSVAHLPKADAADVGCGAVRVGDVLEAIERLQDRLSVPPELAPGQRVILSPSAGAEVTVDDATYLVMPEDAVLAILPSEEE